MFLYLMTMIPCDWIAKIQVLDCVASNNDASTACITAVNETTELFEVSSLLHKTLTPPVPRLQAGSLSCNKDRVADNLVPRVSYLPPASLPPPPTPRLLKTRWVADMF